MSTDYTAMDGPALQEACGDRADRWAEAFMQINEAATTDGSPIDVDFNVMKWWFYTAIKGSEIARERRKMAQMHVEQQAINRAWDEARAARVKVDEMIDKHRAGRTDSADMM